MIVGMADKLHLNPADDDPKLLAQIVDFYHAALKTNAEALDYLKSRGIVHEEVIDRFRIGFCRSFAGTQLRYQTHPSWHGHSDAVRAAWYLA